MFPSNTTSLRPLGRRAARLATLLSAVFCFSFSSASAQGTNLNLVVDANLPTGTYNNVTVHGPAVITITGQVQINGTIHLVTDNPNSDPNSIGGAGIRITDDANYLYGPGTFIADSASVITYANVAGIDGVTAGAIRLPFKQFDIDCDFTYTGSVLSPLGTLGNSFPDTVRSLTLNRPSGATLTHNTAVRELITMRNGNLFTNGFILTLISAAPDIPGLTAASTTVANLGGPSSRIIGPATVQRYINPRFNAGVGYRHYSSSVATSTVADLTTTGFRPVVNAQYNTTPYTQRFQAGVVTPFPNVFYYDQAQVNVSTPGATARTDFDRGWQSPTALSDPLQVTKGYTVYISPAAKVDFVGELNQLDTYQTPLLFANTEVDGGWNFIGNPYPSKLDWNLVGRDATVRDQISQYRSTQGTEGFYATYINGIGANGGSPIIAQNQAFFVRLNPGTSGRVTFTENARLLNFQQDPTAPFYRQAPGQAGARPRLRMNLAGQNLEQETVVYFQQGATTGNDADMDAVHIFGGYPVHFFSMAGAENADINALPEIGSVNDYTLPLVAMIGRAGSYTLNAAEMTDFPAGYQVLLQDAVTGTVQDLTLNPTYAFSTAANADPNRFSIRFRGQSVTGVSETSEVAAADVQVYPNPAHSGASLNLLIPGAAKGSSVAATLYNPVGQRVWSKQYSSALGGVRETIDVPLAKGVYTLQVALADGKKVARRVVVD